MHNIVLSEEAFDELSKLFAGKDFEERVVLLSEIFTDGLRRVRRSAGRTTGGRAESSTRSDANE